MENDGRLRPFAADVVLMRQLDAVGLGRVRAKGQRRPIVDQEDGGGGRGGTAFPARFLERSESVTLSLSLNRQAACVLANAVFNPGKGGKTRCERGRRVRMFLDPMNVPRLKSRLETGG